MNTKFILFQIILMILILPGIFGACTRIDPMVYVNDDGDSTNCPGYDYTTITAALDDYPSCVQINVCSGTYNENDLDLSNTNGILLKGIKDSGSVIINTNYIDLTNSSDIYLKDLEIQNSDSYAIFGDQLNEIDLENIIIRDVTGYAMSKGIFIFDSQDIALKGDIIIDDVSANDFAYGVHLENIDILNLENLDLLEISGVTAQGNNSYANGLSLKNITDISTNALIDIMGIYSKKGSVGLSLTDVSGDFGEIKVSIVNSENSSSNGIYINDSDNSVDIINFNDIVNVSFAISSQLNAYGMVINKNQEVNFNNSVEVKSIGALNDVYGILITNSTVDFQDTLEFSSFISQNEYSLISLDINSSFVNAFDIYDSINSSEDHKVVNLKNNSFFTNHYFSTSTNHDICHKISGNSLAFLSHQSLNNCGYKFSIDNGVVIISDSEIDPTTGIFLQPNSSSVIGEIVNIKYNIIDINEDEIEDVSFIFLDTQTKEVVSVGLVSDEDKVSFPKFEKEITEEDSQATLTEFTNFDIYIISDGYSSVYLEDFPTPALSSNNTQTLALLPEYLDEFIITKEDTTTKELLSVPIYPINCDDSLENTLFCFDLKRPYYEQDYNLDFAKIKFKLNKNDLIDQKIPISGIEVKHLENSTWDNLDVNYEGEDNTYRYYSIVVDSFSEFAFIGNPASCLTDSDCQENFICKTDVCECNLTCPSGEVLNEQSCSCTLINNNSNGNGSETIVNDYTNEGDDDGINQNNDDTNTIDVPNPDVNALNVDGDGVTAHIQGDQDVNSENDFSDRNTIEYVSKRGDDLCNLNCPNGTYLDQQSCVCIKSSNNNFMIWLFGIIILVFIIFNFYKSNKKPIKKENIPDKTNISKDNKINTEKSKKLKSNTIKKSKSSKKKINAKKLKTNIKK